MVGFFLYILVERTDYKVAAVEPTKEIEKHGTVFLLRTQREEGPLKKYLSVFELILWQYMIYVCVCVVRVCFTSVKHRCKLICDDERR